MVYKFIVLYIGLYMFKDIESGRNYEFLSDPRIDSTRKRVLSQEGIL